MTRALGMTNAGESMLGFVVDAGTDTPPLTDKL
jgi:hypothetical protein